MARVYLNWKYRGPAVGRKVPENIEQLYHDSLRELADHPGAKGADFEIRSEEAKFEKDFASALEYMDKAVAADPRPLLRNDRWKLMAKHGDRQIAEQGLREMSQAKADQDFAGSWTGLLPILAATYARLLKASGKPMGQLNEFATGLSDAELGIIIGKMKYERD
tara:strand:+ start:31 stop:522 length:492 start_codon:yes stop_codon:yes gene_type:complete